MCTPTNPLDMLLGKRKTETVKQPDPVDERARAEAEAVQRANAQLAADQRRRREQTLLSRGSTTTNAGAMGSSPTFGDEGFVLNDSGGSTLSGARSSSRTSVARSTATLMSRGGNVGGGGSNFYGGGRTRSQLQ